MPMHLPSGLYMQAALTSYSFASSQLLFITSFLSRHYRKKSSGTLYFPLFVSELMDLIVAGRNQLSTDHSNNLAEIHPIL